MKPWKETKRFVRLWQRRLKDWQSGESKRFARSRAGWAETSSWTCHTLVQPIRPGETFANKLANLQLASKALNGIRILPGEILSFWNLVGCPSKSRGYQASRNIVRGKLESEVGGGLCQISGILYHLSLMAGLEVRERHPHSIDLYADSERFSPLGVDATVVFGYKDLRLANPFPFPVVFQFEIIGAELHCRVLSPQTFPLKNLAFRLEMEGTIKYVEVLDKTIPNSEQVLSVSRYESLKSQEQS